MAQVIDFFKAKRAREQVPHRVDKIKELEQKQSDDLDARITRIRSSIARINQLISELREAQDRG
jgi:hypothetical protein